MQHASTPTTAAIDAMLTTDHPAKMAASVWAEQHMRPIDGAIGFDRERWAKAAAFGVQGSCTPVDLGGHRRSAVDLMLLFEGIGHAGVDTGLAFALASHTVTVERSLAEFGSVAQRERLLHGVLSGDLIGAFAMTEEAGGSNPWTMSTSAEPRDNGTHLLNGAKIWITLAPVADFAIVFASTDADAGRWGVSAFIVDLDLPGVHRGAAIPKMGLESSPWGELRFDDVLLDADALLGPVGAGASLFNHIVESERAFLYAPIVGAAEKVVDRSSERARTRHDDGGPIGRHQAVAHRIVNMAQRHEMARLLLYKAAEVADRGLPLATAACFAKLAATDLGPKTAIDAIRIFGAYGYTQAAQLDRTLCDAIGGLSFSATEDIARNIVAADRRLHRPIRKP